MSSLSFFSVCLLLLCGVFTSSLGFAAAMDEIKTVCNTPLGKPSSPPPGSNATYDTNLNSDANKAVSKQKQEYCAAAKQSAQAAEASKGSSNIYAAAAVVCGSACACSLAGPSCPLSATLTVGCSVSNIGATVYDISKTKEMGTAMMGVMSSLMPMAQGGGKIFTEAGKEISSLTGSGGNSSGQAAGSTGGDAAKSSDSGNSMAVCMSAAMDVMQAMMKKQAAKKDEQAARDNLQNAKALTLAEGEAATDPIAPSAPNLAAKMPTTNSLPAGSEITTGTDTGDDSSNPATKACADASLNPQMSNIAKCSSALDSNLANLVSNPEFHRELMNRTGKDLPTLMGEDAKSTMQGGLGGGLSSDGQSKLASLLDIAENSAQAALPYEVADAAIAGGGSGGHGGGRGAGGDPLGDMLKNMMDQLNPKKEQKPSNVSMDQFRQMTRHPEQVARDKTISIFERVSYRYSVVTARMTGR